jgi:dolichol-phosphate mannosyltransferase
VVLSILIPVYNERDTIREILARVAAVAYGVTIEIIVVEDGSTDGTAELLAALAPSANIRVLHHAANQGKGAAVRSGLAVAGGQYIIIQDADLEVNPQDIPRLLQVVRDTGAKACYGARFLGDNRRFYPLGTYWANRLLTLICNTLHGLHLNDMNTCYKLLLRDLARKIDLKSRGFAMEPEVTSKLARLGIPIREVAIQYQPRMRKDGKKIRAMDFLRYLAAMLKYRLEI